MRLEEIIELAQKLIAVPSLSGQEAGVIALLEQTFTDYGWPVEKIPVAENRENILVVFGNPEIIFTTHVDVVPAPDELFQPKYIKGTLFGRGACDTKGIIATMVAVARRLLELGKTNFGLLFVVGEEDDGIGAKVAAEYLKDRGIKVIINGEPTECKIMLGHKGALELKINFTGTACHSGYPHLGKDANITMFEVAKELLAANYGQDPVLQNSSINIGTVRGGVAANIVSPSAELSCLIRTVTENSGVISKVTEIVRARGEIQVYYDMPPCLLEKIPGFSYDVASFGSDIPNFNPLNAKTVLYGPGSILLAHTDKESISSGDILTSLTDYIKIFDYFKT